MSILEKIQIGKCPNNCGDLTVLKKPVAILHLLSEDLCTLGKLEGTETPEDMFGYIMVICPECGFVGTRPPTYEYDYDNYEWRRSEETQEER